ncbi:TA system VapC family ribonuclease toxin [uncultured Thiocystis sp.]|jgi:toxin-antitoxin system PIN domain toxin|uniref:TA system VapC family ribonuclease toxin n=1 Tax=uncultured Thiocystis sp. TaxID=1202134 RepID=UPI0025D110F2|nr:TA system VapC family ribonuclease toxin [uncultured Thiocystis sp.]
MTDLPDINVWLALVDENHIHHTTAKRYWRDQLTDQAAFCRITMLGLLRLSTQPRVLSRTLTHEEAWRIYRQYLDNPAVCFLAEPASTEAQFAALSLGGDLPHRLWTDTYLAAFAMTTGCRFVSFDSDFKRFSGLNFLHLVSLPSP